jgi:transmembrane sensor
MPPNDQISRQARLRRSQLVTEQNNIPERAANIEREELLEQAAQWSIELSSIEISAERMDAWRRWIAASDAHRDAFDRIQSTFAAIDRCADESLEWPTDADTANDRYDASVSVSAWRAAAPRARGRGTAAAHALFEGMRRRGRWIAVGLAASIVFALAAPSAVQLLESIQPGPAVTIVETRAGENREVALADGSVVSVGARSVLWATLGRETREITLERGEAFFQVAKDPDRPFIVRAGNTRVAAVGTAFNVRRAGKRIVIAVAEGVVNVAAQSASPTHAVREIPRAARLSVGEQLSISGADGSVTMQIVAPRGIAAWREGLLQYRDEPLHSVIADIARYSARDIVIGDAAAADLRVTGTVFTNDVESWIESLEAALPVRAIRTPEGVVRLESRARN